MQRLGRRLRWVGITAAAAIVILLILYAFVVGGTGTRLERRLGALRAAGDPVQLADLAHKPIPPEQNADVFLRRAGDDLEAMQKDLVAWYPNSAYPSGTLSPTDQERLEQLFAAYPKVIPLLEQAADCPDSDPELKCSVPTTVLIKSCMDHTSMHRVIYRILRARSALLLSKGRGDDALAAQVLTLRLTRTWRREPSIMAFLVNAACETVAMDGVNQVLQAGPVASSARQSLDAELALHDTIEELCWALRSERAFSLSSVRELPPYGFWLTRAAANDLMLRLLDLFDRHLAAASRPYAEAVSRNLTASSAGSGWNPLGPLVTHLEPSLAALRDPAERVRALSRSLRVLNALQAREAAGDAREPTLTALGLPAAATIDPFNGEPLRVKKLPEGWMVYSVGSNRVDNGGVLDGKSDIGVGPMSGARSREQKP